MNFSSFVEIIFRVIPKGFLIIAQRFKRWVTSLEWPKSRRDG